MAHIVQKENTADHPYDGDRTSNVHSVYHSPQSQQHEWGGGIRLSEHNDMERHAEKDADSELQHRREGISRSAILRSVLGTSEGIVIPERDREVGGMESRSNESATVASPSSGSSQQRQRNAAFIEAIDKRLSVATAPEGVYSLVPGVSI